ncbi:MAG: hypothetical protein IT577_12955 [Verrucomicrobiae bacterium]|nr:hypothetical protein [Verrucomicrobiae bacterium]
MRTAGVRLWGARASVAGIVLLGGYLGVRMFQLRHADTAHALWWTGDIVVRYLRASGGQWPRSWEDMAIVVRPDDFRVKPVAWGRGGLRVRETRARLPIERLREVVWVDWDADVRELARAPASVDHPPFLVVRPLRGDHVYFEGAEPNEMIREFLARSSARSP